MPCSKQIRQYAECKHFAAPKYIYCGSTDHDDDEEKNKACYENQPRKSKNKSTVVTSIDKQYCSRACEAEFGLWICCLCRESVIAPMERNADNDLYHYNQPEESTELVEHIFCDDCTVPSGRTD